MINLIPPSAERNVTREYWLRVISVWVLLIASACVIVAILNIPVYVLVRSQLEAYVNEYAQAAVESQELADSKATVDATNQIAQRLAASNDSTSFSTVLTELEKMSGNEIVITESVLSRKDGALGLVTITGVARSRAALTSFHSAIIAHELFKQADLPLSNLAQDKDIIFTITVEPEIATQ